MRNTTRSVAAAALMGTAAAGASAQQGQAVQWRVEDGGNGHWYEAVPSLVQWSAARQGARSRGGDLACFETQEEFEWCRQQWWCATSLFFHIGGVQDAGASTTVSDWRWITGGAVDLGVQRDMDDSPCATGCCGENGEQNFLHMYPGCAVLGDVNDGPTSSCPAHRSAHSSIIEWSADCNSDGIVDYGQCLDGSLADYDGNNIPDCCESGTPCASNLLVNGSFELGPEQPCGWICMAVGDHRLLGWDVVLNSVDRQRTDPSGCNQGWFASHGRYSVDLNGCSIGGKIRQEIPARQGRIYRLRFDLSLNPENVDRGRVLVRTGNETHELEYERRPSDPQPPERREIVFSASEHWTAIEFESLNREYPSQWAGPIIDNVRLEEILCPGDITQNGAVDGVDLAIVLGAWGTSGQGEFKADIDRDGVVSGTDLAYVLGGWGPCQ